MKLDILFRSCATVPTFTGPPRFIDVPKAEIVIRSLHSLVQSIGCALSVTRDHTISLTVIDDHSPESCTGILKGLLHTVPIPTQFIPLKRSGNSASLKENYLHARENCTALIYFVEDDYLHDRFAIWEILDSYDLLQAKAGSDIILHPSDYPDRYQAPEPSKIYLGINRHWRTIFHTTGTFITTNALLNQYWDNYMGFSEYGTRDGVTEDNTINLIYRHIPCLSPLPSLAVHLQYESTLSPYVDWKKWWDDAKI